MLVNTTKVILRGVLFSVVFIVNVVAQNYFNWKETEDYYPVIIESATVDDVPVQDGDEIAVFFLNDSNQLTCGGAIIWPDQGLKSWGDDSQTAEKDGFSQSEQLVFKIYDVSRGEYFYSVTSTWSIGNGTWGDGQYGKCALLDFLTPVELSFFKVYIKQRQIVLEWSTQSETNNLGFEIQKSRDKKNFYKIDFIRGNGTSLNEKNYKFIDRDLEFGYHFYRLKQIDTDGSFDYSPIVEVFISPPKAFALIQNYPNPFNPETDIRFELPQAAHVELMIFNTLGQKIKTLSEKEFSVGSHTIRWDGKDDFGNQVSGGLYLCRMLTTDYQKTVRMLFLK